MPDALRAAYLSIDRRVLGLFRLVFASVLLGDLAYHAAEATLLYSNRGTVPNHRVLFAPQSPIQFSIYLAFSTPTEIKIAFALTALAYLGLLVGWKTRLWQLVAFVCVTSLNARNLFTEDGGCMTLNLLAAWTMLLPLGDRFSLDALIREARGDAPPSKEPVVSLLVLGLTLQVALIYAFNTLHKTGTTWRDGSAIHWVLWQDRMSTPLAVWLRMHEPGWLSPLLSWSTLVIEGAIPLLVLSPRFQWQARTVAIALSWSLHAGIASVMTLGPFSYGMMALLLLMLPPESFDWAAARLAKTRLGELQRRVEASLRAWVVARVTRDPARPRWRFLGEWGEHAREGWAIYLFVISVFSVLDTNPIVPARLRQHPPAAIEALRAYPRLTQFWAMFSPDVPTDDGILVIDATTASGEHIDPFNGKKPELDGFGRTSLPYDALVADYLFKVGSFKNELDRRELDRYLREWQETEGRPAKDQIVAYEGWLFTWASPLPHTTTIRNLKREVVMKWP